MTTDHDRKRAEELHYEWAKRMTKHSWNREPTEQELRSIGVIPYLAGYLAACEEKNRVIEQVRSALFDGRECPRELFALMAEGEGSDFTVYMEMANHGLNQMSKIKQALKDSGAGGGE